METQKNETKNTMELGVFTFYDCVLKQFEIPFILPTQKLNDYLDAVVNNVESKFYKHENNYYIVRIGIYNEETAEIKNIQHQQIATLDKYINDKKRTMQTIIQTLNYLPTGYFKMPEEMKKQIQKDIDAGIKEYIENFVIPDIDTNQILNNYKNENKNLKKEIEDLKELYKEYTPSKENL